jgi:2-hydroxychromene-2-carboxylate isomerase
MIPPIPMKSVRFYFDFISPYSYLASCLIEKRPELREIAFEYRPVVFGSILSKLGTTGPGEVPSKRRGGLTDVLLLASAYGVALEGPPSHPFNSIYALRSVCAVSDEAVRGRLMQRYFRAAWAEGKSLEDMSVLRACLRDAGVEDQDPDAASSAAENRRMLKAYTAELIEAGGFGVPTFITDGLCFWGHDRLELLRTYLNGQVHWDGGAKLAELLARPQPGRIT